MYSAGNQPRNTAAVDTIHFEGCLTNVASLSSCTYVYSKRIRYSDNNMKKKMKMRHGSGQIFETTYSYVFLLKLEQKWKCRERVRLRETLKQMYCVRKVISFNISRRAFRNSTNFPSNASVLGCKAYIFDEKINKTCTVYICPSIVFNNSEYLK